MEKKQSSFLVAFPVSSVYFGALVGPSMVSGAFAAVRSEERRVGKECKA